MKLIIRKKDRLARHNFVRGKPVVDGGGSTPPSAYDLLLASASSILNGDANADATGDANDLRGNYNGTWGGTAVYGTAPAGKGTGKSFVLDGAKYVTQVSAAGPFTFSGHTVASWIKVSSLAGRIVSKRDDAVAAWEVYLNADGSVSLYTGSTYSSAAGAITVDTWHHVAVVFDGFESQLYIDGAESGAAYGPEMTSNSQFVNWGRLPAYGGMGYLTGELYQCAIWPLALTAGDVAVLHAG